MQAHTHRASAQQHHQPHEQPARVYASKSQALRGAVRRQLEQRPFNQLVVPPPPDKPRPTAPPPVAAENVNTGGHSNAVAPAR
jgi:hypothetical protein